MIAIIKQTKEGFSTTVLNDDLMSQPSAEEQRAFMSKYAASVLRPTHLTATAGSECVIVSKPTEERCAEGEKK